MARPPLRAPNLGCGGEAAPQGREAAAKAEKLARRKPRTSRGAPTASRRPEEDHRASARRWRRSCTRPASPLRADRGLDRRRRRRDGREAVLQGPDRARRLGRAGQGPRREVRRRTDGTQESRRFLPQRPRLRRPPPWRQAVRWRGRDPGQHHRAPARHQVVAGRRASAWARITRSSPPSEGAVTFHKGLKGRTFISVLPAGGGRRVSRNGPSQDRSTDRGIGEAGRSPNLSVSVSKRARRYHVGGSARESCEMASDVRSDVGEDAYRTDPTRASRSSRPSASSCARCGGPTPG